MPNSIFSIEGSLISLNTAGDVPCFSRETPVNFERFVAGSLQLYPIESNAPAISYEDGSFLLEPACSNLVTWNLDISKPVWVKGSNVTARIDYAGQGEYAPDGTPRSDRLRWDTGAGNSQKMVRNFSLQAATDYTLSLILRLRDGNFGPNDYLRVLGDVAGTAQVGLASVNEYKNLYKVLTLTFKTAGKIPIPPGNPHQVGRYAITAVTQNTVALTVPNGYSVAVNDWQGGTLFINGQSYLITANTATGSNPQNNQSIIVTVNVNTLVSNGVTTSMFAQLRESPLQNVAVELYSERTVSIDWGGMQLEQRNFRTSMIYQDGEILTRAKSLLHWRKSPIAGMKSFAIYAELRDWRGDGNVFDFGNLKGEIVNSRLVVTAGNTVVNLTQILPSPCKILIQVSEVNSSLSVYVNNILRGRSTTSNFTGENNAALVFTSSGLRHWQRFLVYDQTLLEGQVNIGESGKLEVEALFRNKVPIDSVAISAHAPLINLPPVVVPAKLPPTAETVVTGIDPGNKTVAVKSVSGFVETAFVEVMRGDYVIGMPILADINMNIMTLEPFPPVLVGDVIVFGRSMSPGYATARFPFEAIDPQIITAIDTSNKRVTVSSVLSFTRDRAIVRTALYEDVAEVTVKDIDLGNNYLFLDSVENITVGCVIAQPRELSELFISVSNYFAGLTESIPGVQISTQKGKWLNGVKVENWNPYPVQVTPYIRPFL